MRAAARTLRNAWLDLRTLRWLMRLRFELRRNGGRLKVEGWRGVRMAERPRIRTTPLGEGSGVTTIRFSPEAMFGYGVIVELSARGDNHLELGRGARIYDGVRLDLRGGAIRLADHSMVHGNCVLKSDGELVLGQEVRISYGSCVHCYERIEFGRHTGLGEYVTVLDSDHSPDGSDTPYLSQPLRSDPVVIESNVMLARGAVILRGVRIGSNSLVAANAVVPSGSYPARSLLAGMPAKRIRELTPKAEQG